MQAVDLSQEDIHTYLARHQKKELLRFLTCGSVDDGKSTLIGRLLHDTKMIYEDQLAAVKRDSEKVGTTGAGEIDLALLTDGLKAEREQGITIDVAYRYFSTDRRKFIIADTPGHEQYTRNMATGASTCQLAIILIDARHGVMTQTRRHSFIVSLLGIRHVVVAINKMDLVGYSRDVFERIKDDYTGFVAKLDLRDITFIPMSALKGDNVVSRSDAMPWYSGPPLLDHLETVHIASDRNLTDLRFPVQYVIRPNLDFRGFAGTVASGILRKGDEVMVLPSGKRSRVKSIVTYDGELEEAFAPQAVTVTLTDEVDVSRGDMLVRPDNPPHVSSQIEAMVVWMAEQPFVPGRTYTLKHTTRQVTAEVASFRYGVDVNTLEHRAIARLGLNEVGHVQLSLTQAAGVRPVPHQRRDRGVHPHRPADEQHGRGGDDPGGRQRPGAGRRLGGGAGGAPQAAREPDRAGRARAALRPGAGDGAAGRADGQRQEPDRVRAGAPPVGRGPGGDGAVRPEHAAGAEPRPGVHRRRPLGEPAAVGRGGEIDERRGGDHHRGVRGAARGGAREGEAVDRPGPRAHLTVRFLSRHRSHRFVGAGVVGVTGREDFGDVRHRPVADRVGQFADAVS